MTPSRLVALLLLGALAALSPLAYASPPDPTWIAGLYDDGDSDAVVLLVVDGVSDLPAASVATLAVIAIVIGMVPGLCPHKAAGLPRLADFGRAPPLS